LYTELEIKSLLAAALALPKQTAPLRPWTYHALLGLLSVSALRVSEALNLKREDADLQQGLLTIRATKFGKSRLVPLHASTTAVLTDYLARRDRLLRCCPNSYVFVSGRGQRLDGGDVRRTFYHLSRQVGLRGSTHSCGPRLHDFRHRFATNTLLQWYRAGDDIERQLPVLSTYLGHVHVSDTYWYLSAYPQLLGEATHRLEQRWGKPS
jgi:integrase